MWWNEYVFCALCSYFCFRWRLILKGIAMTLWARTISLHFFFLILNFSCWITNVQNGGKFEYILVLGLEHLSLGWRPIVENQPYYQIYPLSNLLKYVETYSSWVEPKQSSSKKPLKKKKRKDCKKWKRRKIIKNEVKK